MANVSFKKSNNKSANELPNEINEGTIYITKEQEMYLDIDSTSRVQIAGNIIYKDLDNVVNPDTDTELPPTFGGHTVNDFLLTTGGIMTGNLILNSNPTNNLGAATKQYVDDSIPKIYREDYIANGNETTISIPNSIQDYNNIMVYQNGLLLIEDVNFEISGTDITFIDYSLNPGETITFIGPLYTSANLINSFSYNDSMNEQSAILEGEDGISTSDTSSADLGLKYTISNIDIGVGATLAKDTLYFVYE